MPSPAFTTLRLRLAELFQRDAFAHFQIDRPLWVFFGAKVNAAEESDIMDVLMFLAGCVKDRAASVKRLDLLLSCKDGMANKAGHLIFARHFDYLTTRVKLSADETWEDILRIDFNAPAGDTQHVIFVDPKGLRQSEGWSDPKIKFHHEIKRLEMRVGVPKLRLHSFILSASPDQTLINSGPDVASEDFNAAGVLFLDGGPTVWLKSLMERCLEQSSSRSLKLSSDGR